MKRTDARKAPGAVAIKPSRGDRIFDVLNVVVLLLVFVFVMFPLIYTVSCSLSDPGMVVGGKIVLLPRKVTLIAYERVFKNQLLLSGYINTIVYTLLGTAINLFLTTITAYPLSRRDFKARRPITLLFTFTMLFSGGLIPTYLLVSSLGLVNTMWALLLPGAISAWNMLIMKNFFQSSIPLELYESARIDGADNIRILTSIVLPLSMPIIAVMVMYYGVSHWNSYFDALIYLNDRFKYPLQLVMRSFFLNTDYAEQGAAGDESGVTALLVAETMKYAIIVVASLPMLCLYPFLQRFFVKGVMLGAIKG